MRNLNQPPDNNGMLVGKETNQNRYGEARDGSIYDKIAEREGIREAGA